MRRLSLAKSMNPEILDHLGDALTVLRRRSGKLQKEIAEETGMAKSQVSRYERGRDRPNLATLVRYLIAVGADFQALHLALSESEHSQSTPEVNPEVVRVLSLPLFDAIRQLVDHRIAERLAAFGLTVPWAPDPNGRKSRRRHEEHVGMCSNNE